MRLISWFVSQMQAVFAVDLPSLVVMCPYRPTHDCNFVYNCCDRNLSPFNIVLDVAFHFRRLATFLSRSKHSNDLTTIHPHSINSWWASRNVSPNQLISEVSTEIGLFWLSRGRCYLSDPDKFYR